MADLMERARQVTLAEIEADFAKVAERCRQIYKRKPAPRGQAATPKAPPAKPGGKTGRKR